MHSPKENGKKGPTKRMRVGALDFEIAGLSETDHYYTHLGDTFEPWFNEVCANLLKPNYICLDIGANIGLTALTIGQYVPSTSSQRF
jgi:deoxyadenosine/deoxycytidine kinase